MSSCPASQLYSSTAGQDMCHDVMMNVEALQADRRSHAAWALSRPPPFETEAVRQLLAALKDDVTPAKPGFVLHIAHVSAAEVLPLLAEAKAQGTGS